MSLATRNAMALAAIAASINAVVISAPSPSQATAR